MEQALSCAAAVVLHILAKRHTPANCRSTLSSCSAIFELVLVANSTVSEDDLPIGLLFLPEANSASAISSSFNETSSRRH